MTKGGFNSFTGSLMIDDLPRLWMTIVRIIKRLEGRIAGGES